MAKKDRAFVLMDQYKLRKISEEELRRRIVEEGLESFMEVNQDGVKIYARPTRPREIEVNEEAKVLELT